MFPFASFSLVGFASRGHYRKAGEGRGAIDLPGQSRIICPGSHGWEQGWVVEGWVPFQNICKTGFIATFFYFLFCLIWSVVSVASASSLE